MLLVIAGCAVVVSWQFRVLRARVSSLGLSLSGSVGFVGLVCETKKNLQHKERGVGIEATSLVLHDR